MPMRVYVCVLQCVGEYECVGLVYSMSARMVFVTAGACLLQFVCLCLHGCVCVFL